MRLPKSHALRYAAYIMAFGVAARLILNIGFYALYGPHSVNHVELWLYYGVALGKLLTAGGAGDPSVWLMHLMGALSNGDGLLWGVATLSVFLTALSAVLIFLIVREFLDEDTGLYAGLIYAFMVQPLALSLVGFTHDHVVTPLALISLLLFIRAVRERSYWRKAAYFAGFAVLLYLGGRVNIGMYVTGGVAAVCLGARLMRRYPGFYPHFSLALLVGFILVGSCILPAVMDYQLGMLPQGRLGSADIVPLSLGNLWLKYNVLLLFLPLGVLAAYRRQEYISLSYAAIGFIFAFDMDRGTRLADIGVAMLAAYALLEWRVRYGRTFAYAAVAFLAASIILGLLPPAYTIPIALAAAALAYIAWAKKLKAIQVVAVLAVLGVALTVAGMYASKDKAISEAEYELYSETLRGLDRGVVLAPWDRGFMAETLSGLSAASSPAGVDYPAHDAFWMPQEQANAALNREGIDYIVFSDTYYNNIIHLGRDYYLLQGGLMFSPKEKPPIVISDEMTAYKLRYGGYDEGYFRLLKSVNDTAFGREYMIYRVVKADANRTLVSIAAYDNEPSPVPAEVEINVETYAGGKKPEPSYGISKETLTSPGAYFGCIIKTLIRLIALGLMAAIVHTVASLRNARGKATKILLKRAAAFLAALAVLAAVAYAMNQAGGQTAEAKNQSVSVTVRSFNVTFQPNLTVTSYDVGAVGDIYNCSAKIKEDGPQGYAGYVTFSNSCEHIDEKAAVLLVDATASQEAGKLITEDYVEVNLSLDKGGQKRVDYAFSRKYPYHEYAVGFWKSACVSAIAEESKEPQARGIETYHVFCGRTTDLRDYDRID